MRTSNYDKAPFVAVKGYNGQAWRGYASIIEALQTKISARNQLVTVLTVECYPGVKQTEVLTALVQGLDPTLVVMADDASFSGEKITHMIARNLTDDRVFGVMSHHNLDEFFDTEKIAAQREKIAAVQNGVVLVYGFGASLVAQGDVLVYADLARWELQMRYRRKEQCNWKMDNFEEEQLKKYKRGFFVEWRLADRLKKSLYSKMDFLLDTNTYDDPKMLTGEAFLAGLSQAAAAPFRVVPYFDPGVWGGQWMKEVCDLDRTQQNFAWSFDGVPEENSIYLQYGAVRVEVPSINVVFRCPKELLGEKVHARFGTEFPIRFDFLDTMGGQNLSLQVHPLTEYIQDKFGMHYTQDESYYILDAQDGAVVYLGTKEGINPKAMMDDLKSAQRGEKTFPDELYINQFPAKKHDHFLIPAGTIHCSGTGTMVLEISATPYIFTFKLWDWDRLGLDGRPRPVHIEHGEQVIAWERDTKWVRENLVDQVEKLEQGDGWREERTGLHSREFIETRRYWFTAPVPMHTGGSVNMLNLVQGEEAVVESPTGAFAPFVVHYAETFIIPATVGAYTIAPHGANRGAELAVIKASVRI